MIHLSTLKIFYEVLKVWFTSGFNFLEENRPEKHYWM